MYFYPRLAVRSVQDYVFPLRVEPDVWLAFGRPYHAGIRTSAPTCVQEQYSVQLPRFECPPPGNCTLPYNLVNDDVCDCPGTCADEEKWNCDTCMCPEVCGNRHRNCFDVFFQCPGTNCTISVFSLNDRHCDCPDCSDEEDWTCETCLAGCPTTKTCQSLWVYACESAGFACIFGSSECIFPWSAVNDNFCNCPFCEDEDAWDCSNCSSGCTGELCDFVLGNGLDYNRKNERGYTWQRRTNCFGEQLTPPDYSVQCPGYPANSGFPATQPGCTIPFTALNDNRCDCPTCSRVAVDACGVFWTILVRFFAKTCENYLPSVLVPSLQILGSCD